jgi:hypothetical protein
LIHPPTIFFYIFCISDELIADKMNLGVYITFCIDISGLVIAVILVLYFGPWLIMVALGGGRNNNAKTE